jgi:hypothetical protein
VRYEYKEGKVEGESIRWLHARWIAESILYRHCFCSSVVAGAGIGETVISIFWEATSHARIHTYLVYVKKDSS